MADTSTQRWERYYTPASVAEALEILQRYDGQARVIGGGTDLLVETRRGLHRPVMAMVDVTRIEGLDSIEEDGDFIVIGLQPYPNDLQQVLVVIQNENPIHVTLPDSYFA